MHWVLALGASQGVFYQRPGTWCCSWGEEAKCPAGGEGWGTERGIYENQAWLAPGSLHPSNGGQPQGECLAGMDLPTRPGRMYTSLPQHWEMIERAFVWPGASWALEDGLEQRSP